MYVVNPEKCTGCGSCVDVCPPEAIAVQNGKAVISMHCIDCGACPRVCPEGAIKKQRPSVAAAKDVHKH